MRIANSVLKKLSRSQDSKLRFRVHLLLGSALPQITDRSAVNLRGAFSNRKLKLPAVFDEHFSQVRKIVEASKDPQTYCKGTNIDLVMQDAEKLLNFLDEVKTVEIPDSCFAIQETVIDFQLKDFNFVCYLVSQIALLCQTVLNPANQTQTTDFDYTEVTKAKINSVWKHAAASLENHSKTVSDLVEVAIKRETQWVKWKLEGCPSFEKFPATEATSVMENDLEEGEVVSYDQTAPSTNPLFEQNELLPTMQTYLARVYQDMDPDEQIEEEFKVKKDPVYSWRCLRLVSFSNLEVFKKLNFPEIEGVAKALRGDTKDLEFQTNLVFHFSLLEKPLIEVYTTEETFPQKHQRDHLPEESPSKVPKPN